MPQLLGLAAVAWVGLLVAAPVLPGWPSAAMYAIGSLVCHQIPERSFFLGEFQLPVCARCLGLYIGGMLGVAARVTPSPIRLRWSTARQARQLAALGAIPTMLTLMFEWSGVWTPGNLTRAVAAVPAGWAIGFAAAWATLHYGRCESRHPAPLNQPRQPI